MAAGAAALAVLASSAASAAPAPVRTVDPLVALSIFGSAASRTALCAAGAAAVAAGAAQSGLATPGCVLPVVDAPPPVAAEAPPPIAPAPPAVVQSAGMGMLPFFGALAAFVGLVLLVDKPLHGHVHFDNVPISPF